MNEYAREQWWIENSEEGEPIRIAKSTFEDGSVFEGGFTEKQKKQILPR